MNILFRKSSIHDVKDIHSLLLKTAADGTLLPRSLSQLYNHCRDFLVAEFEGTVIGCCALSLIWEDLAEVRTLFVKDEFRRSGVGKNLVLRCMEEGKALGIKNVFCLTYQCDFFSSLGFNEVSKDILPHKVWADCLQCAKFPNCDEVAMLRAI